MVASRVRVGGSGFTVFSWRNNTIGWLQSVSDTAPRTVAPAKVIQPLDSTTPVEIVTAKAVGAGTLVLEVVELWNGPVWQELLGLDKAKNILDIFAAQLQILNGITCTKVIKTPDGNWRTKTYSGCMITDVDESETVQISTMEFPKKITIQYTTATWDK